MLHPLLIVTVGVVLAGVGTTRLLTSGSRSSSLGTVRFVLARDPKSFTRGYVRASQQVAELKGLH